MHAARMAEKKLEAFINGYNYEENAALQNHCLFNTITEAAFQMCPECKRLPGPSQKWLTCQLIITRENSRTSGTAVV